MNKNITNQTFWEWLTHREDYTLYDTNTEVTYSKPKPKQVHSEYKTNVRGHYRNLAWVEPHKRKVNSLYHLKRDCKVREVRVPRIVKYDSPLQTIVNYTVNTGIAIFLIYCLFKLNY